jgi:hypothetical protein
MRNRGMGPDGHPVEGIDARVILRDRPSAVVSRRDHTGLHVDKRSAETESRDVPLVQPREFLADNIRKASCQRATSIPHSLRVQVQRTCPKRARIG